MDEAKHYKFLKTGLVQILDTLKMKKKTFVKSPDKNMIIRH